MRLRPLLIAAGLNLAVSLAYAQSNMVLLVFPPNNYINQGRIYVTTNRSDIVLSGTPTALMVSASGFTVCLAGPGGSMLTTGAYSNTVRSSSNNISPRLDVSGNGRDCFTACGNFEILELHTDISSNVDRLWVTFTYVCECNTTPMTGEIRYDSTFAPAAPVPKTIRVPADFATVQAAIDSASALAGDTVLVSPGLYGESITFKGKCVTVASAGGATATIISPPSGSSAAVFNWGETSNSVLCGFTLTNASTGISVSFSSPSIVSNVIVNCGNGVDCKASSPVVLHNQILGCSGNAIFLGAAGTARIEGNIIKTNQGGVNMSAAGSPLIKNNLFQGNTGDAISMYNQSDALIVQNVIIENAGNGIGWLTPYDTRGPFVVNNTIAKNGGAGISAGGFDDNAVIVNNIILGTPAFTLGGFGVNHFPIVKFNDIYSPAGTAYAYAVGTSNMTGVAGNLSVDPWFVCFPNHNFHLLAGSPCIDRGMNEAVLLSDYDFDYTPRTLAGTTNTQPTVDMGAYEFDSALQSEPCLYIDCPSNIVVVASPGQTSAVVNYPPPFGSPAGSITSLPPSGSVFPAGSTTVTCKASYSSNSVSGTFRVVVLVPPKIISQSPSTNVLAGTTIMLSVFAVGTAPLTYCWILNNSTISGAHSGFRLIPNVQTTNEGVYYIVVTNSIGAITSAPISLGVLPSAPIIVSNPISLALPASSNATFRVDAVGNEPLAWQWFFNGTAISGATGSQYSLRSIQLSDAGSYQCLVTNYYGNATSRVAALTVLFKASQPRVDIARPETFGLTVGWSESNRLYRLQFKTNLLNSVWQSLDPWLTGNGSNLGLFDLGATNQHRFYRLESTNL